jgi:N-acetylglutamate synthase-like GNAT family acetyltransferase
VIELRRAAPEDRRPLIDLLWENGMGHAEPISDYLLAFDGDDVLGCIRLEEFQDITMIRPIVVTQRHRKKGIGRLLVERILPVDKPTAVVARGDAVSFYKTLGFVKTEWEMIPESQLDECRSCPDRKVCQPQPMRRGRVRQHTISE